ncbi:13312_t:CDS:1, partial [Dentiscutata erythropus]
NNTENRSRYIIRTPMVLAIAATEPDCRLPEVIAAMEPEHHNQSPYTVAAAMKPSYLH